jgi:hypothetical protein
VEVSASAALEIGVQFPVFGNAEVITLTG